MHTSSGSLPSTPSSDSERAALLPFFNAVFVVRIGNIAQNSIGYCSWLQSVLLGLLRSNVSNKRTNTKGKLMFNLPLSIFTRIIALGIALLSFAPASPGQLVASPPVAHPTDTRFQNVKEDFTSPALTSSHLQPAAPLGRLVDDQPGYTVELLQVQWRPGDPLDLYVMKPKGVRNPR